MKNATELKVPLDDSPSDMLASTDMGNVSQIKLSIHPLVRIPTDGPHHTHAFTKVTGSQEAQLPTLNSAKSVAVAAIGLKCNSRLLVNAKKT